jgi:hypothetical protein
MNEHTIIYGLILMVVFQVRFISGANGKYLSDMPDWKICYNIFCLIVYLIGLGLVIYGLIQGTKIIIGV